MASQLQHTTNREVIRPARILKVKKGQLLLYEGRAARVIAVCSPNEVLLRIDGTDETLWTAAGKLCAYLAVPSPELPTRPFQPNEDDAAMTRATQWVCQFERYVSNNCLCSQDRAAIAETMESSERTVGRHLDLYLADPSPYSQLSCKPGPEKGVGMLSAPLEAIISRAIKEKYETEERPGIQATVDRAGLLAHAAGLTPPSYAAVHTRIQQLDRWKVARKRHGRVRGDALAGPAGPSLEGLMPLDFVQMDHAIVDVIVVDQDTREEIGRPWITLAIDVASRCVLGFYLTFDHPSQTSVSLTMEHSCCPKDQWLEEIGYEGEWLPFGLMKVIGWDNDKGFKPESLVKACRSYGIEPLYRRVRTPTHGAYIERYIGNYMGKVHLLKGTTFSNTKQREDYPSQKKAVMSLPELILWTAHQINGVYHNTPHGGMGGRTPLEAWQAARMRNGQYDIPAYPANRRAFRLSLLPGTYRKVSRSGISRFHLLYWDEALMPMMEDKKRYWVAHDPRNISCVYLREDGNEYLDIPWRDRSQRPMALFELDRAKRELKAQHDAPYSEAQVFKHLEQLRAIEENAEVTTRTARRDRARRPKIGALPEPAQRLCEIDYTQASFLLPDPLRARQ